MAAKRRRNRKTQRRVVFEPLTQLEYIECTTSPFASLARFCGYQPLSIQYPEFMYKDILGEAGQLAKRDGVVAFFSSYIKNGIRIEGSIIDRSINSNTAGSLI